MKNGCTQAQPQPLPQRPPPPPVAASASAPAARDSSMSLIPRIPSGSRRSSRRHSMMTHGCNVGMDISGENLSSTSSSDDEEDDDRRMTPLIMNGSNQPHSVTDGSDDSADHTQRQQQQQQQQDTTEEVLRKASQYLQEEHESSQDFDPRRTAARATSPQHLQQQSLQQQHALVVVERDIEPLDISYVCTPETLQVKNVLLRRLNVSIPKGRLLVVDLSRRGLGLADADKVSQLVRHNQQLSVLKLACNDFGDEGVATIAASCVVEKQRQDEAGIIRVHHPALSVLDLGFNNIGDEGCSALALHVLAGNPTLRTLYLSGNYIKTKGTASIAGAILHGAVGLASLHLSTNPIGSKGMKILAGAVARSEARRIRLAQQSSDLMVVPPTPLEELYLNDIGINRLNSFGEKKRSGFLSLPSMILANAAIKVLSLSNNSIDDNDLDLLSKAISQNNQSMPLTYIDLSFNQISCVGVESLMNAIWGSKTLRVMKLDNNKIQDRGAQLCSVVLGVVALQMLDISYNRVTTVGIKAIMKTLSENQTMRSFSMAGMAIDQNASKATSYALAYNTTLQALNIDSCSIGYSGQRHIVAGIVSNREVKLRSLTGFPLGPITMTLGIPQLPQDWGNDRILSFVRYMWFNHRLHNSMSRFGRSTEVKRGPEAPATVATAAKRAFAALSESESARIRFEEEHVELEGSPVLPADAAILEGARDGGLRVPAWNDGFDGGTGGDTNTEGWSETDSFGRSSYSGESFDDDYADDEHEDDENGTGFTRRRTSTTSLDHAGKRRVMDLERRQRNVQWLHTHAESIEAADKMEFRNSDLWQLHQYFFSPAYCATDEKAGSSTTAVGNNLHEAGNSNSDARTDTSRTVGSESEQTELSQNGANHATREPAAVTASLPSTASISKGMNGKKSVSFNENGPILLSSPDKLTSHKRPSALLSSNGKSLQPSAKRAKNLMPRIDYYPRIRRKLESLGTKPSTHTLSLLRKLKYIESVMFPNKNVYAEADNATSLGKSVKSDGPTFEDAEMILLDLL